MRLHQALLPWSCSRLANTAKPIHSHKTVNKINAGPGSPRFDAMRALVQVLEGGSYRRAGVQLGLHKATVSALVRVLPDWQCPTLPRHRVTPTARKRAARVQAFMDWAHALLLRRMGAQREVR